ncbi:hypothetical protein [Saccharopolyspora tripterygii]
MKTSPPPPVVSGWPASTGPASPVPEAISGACWDGVPPCRSSRTEGGCARVSSAPIRPCQDDPQS